MSKLYFIKEDLVKVLNIFKLIGDLLSKLIFFLIPFLISFLLSWLLLTSLILFSLFIFSSELIFDKTLYVCCFKNLHNKADIYDKHIDIWK